jgi:hypothetical protein
MKILLRFLGFALAYIAPLIFFIGTNRGLDIVEHDKWICFLFIPVTAFIFTLLINSGTKDLGKPLKIRVLDTPTGEVKTVWNPFWGWFIVTVVLQVILTFLYE